MTPITIRIKQNGPYLIAAEHAQDLIIQDHNGDSVALPEGKGIALCRCGASSRKPFCDGTHSKIGFLGAMAAAQTSDATGSSGGGSAA